MGNFESFNATAYVDDNADVDQGRKQAVQDNAALIYWWGLGAWVVGWVLLMRRRVAENGWVAAGGVIGALFLAVNIWQAKSETIGTYAVEKAEAGALERNSFSLVVTLFAFGNIASSLDKDRIRKVLPLLMLTLFFAVVLVFAPIWVSTTDPVPTIEMKHIRSVCVIYALGFMTASLATVMGAGKK